MENRKIEDNKLKDVNSGLIEPYQGEYAQHCGFFEKKDYSGPDICDNCHEWVNGRCGRHRY